MRAIAIDGPAGAGKSTVARGAAKKLGYIYVDTGALYRAIGLYALDHGVSPDDAQAVPALLPQIDVQLKFLGGEQHVFVNGEDVSQQIRLPACSMAASNVSAMPPVRAFLFDLQRKLAAENDVIMDGRDIGTVVLPNADVKLFLTASPEERANRRYRELQEKGTPVDYDALLEEIKQRDHNDSTRAIAPLKKADDAVEVDTTGYSLESSIAMVCEIIEKKLAQAK